MRMFEFQPNKETDALAVAYLHSPMVEVPNYRTVRPCIIVIPGGGYGMCSLREADPVAFEYFTAGFQVILLKQYSVKEKAVDFNPLKDISLTIMKIRENAKEWGVDEDKIAVCGFSAGGHLAASIGTMWNHSRLLEKLDTKDGMNRPNAMILCYPVIRADEYAHEGSIRNVSGAEPGTAEYSFWAMENHVSVDTCPAFLWHTGGDVSVPVENSLAMVNALQSHHVPYEFHVFPGGYHGMSVCTVETNSKDAYTSRWMELSKMWLYRVFDFEK